MDRAVLPSCCLTWGPTIVEVMKIMPTSFKGPMQALLKSIPLALQQATINPWRLLHWRLLDIHGQVWVSLLWGSLPLSPGSWCRQSSVCALQESVFPVLCKFWQFYGGVNGNLLQEGLCHTQVCCTQSPAPAAGHCWPIPLQETLKHSSGYGLIS